jgi:hypothetical protein
VPGQGAAVADVADALTIGWDTLKMLRAIASRALRAERF